MRNGSVCIRRLAVVLLGTLTWRAAFSRCGLMRGSPGIIANRILGVLGAVVWLGLFGTASNAQDTAMPLARMADAPTTPFIEPEVRRSHHGLLDTTLRVALVQSSLPAGKMALHRSYEGMLTGPTLRVRPGDRLRILLINALPPNDPKTCRDYHGHNGEHCVNTTNLHTHGLHVSPTGNSDNVLLTIKPGESVQYQIDIPDDHPAGTFWYHAHKHGAVAAQLREGMAGALIIEGDIDAVPEISIATERLFVLQQLRIPYNGGDNAQLPTSINGQVNPLIEMQAGEVQRWRFVHAGINETLNVHIVKCASATDTKCASLAQPIYQIAADGITIGNLHTPTDSLSGRTIPNTLLLQPGYRADILLRLEAGNYALVKKSVDAKRGLLQVAELPQFLARIAVDKTRKDMDFPRDAILAGLAPFAPIETVDNPGKPRKITFNENGDFNDINGELFEPGRIDQTLELNATEEWHLASKEGAHPFHIHVNPFQVVGGDPDNPGFWKDTIIVPDDRRITIRSRYDVFTGKFVLHCHILDHEDRGMMQLVEIVP